MVAEQGDVIKLLLLVGLAAALAVVATAGAARARGRYIEGGPDSLTGTRSLGDLIRGPGGPVHIMFVHGMRAEGAGTSDAFREALLRMHGGGNAAAVRSARHYLDLGDKPEAKVGEEPIWKNRAEWEASRPFVERHTLTLANGKTVTIDEVNWWPLLFPIKCRFLLLPEVDLAGADREHLQLCARSGSGYHPWLSEQQLRDALATRPRSGGGAPVNRSIKHQILNWGLSDAVIALGPMKTYLVAAMEKAFAYGETQAQSLVAGERMVISESLGSFVVMEAFARRTRAVRAFLDRTHSLYFFANQFALLELGRIRGIVPPKTADPELAAAFAATVQAPIAKSEAGDPIPPSPTPLSGLADWAAGDGAKGSAEARELKQVISFSDPSDLLTYRVPKIEGATVVNLYVRNAPSFLGLLANPAKAHTGHVDNPAVWRVLLRPSR